RSPRREACWPAVRQWIVYIQQKVFSFSKVLLFRIEQCGGGADIGFNIADSFAIKIGLKRPQSLADVEASGLEIDGWCGGLGHRATLRSGRRRGPYKAAASELSTA